MKYRLIVLLAAVFAAAVLLCGCGAQTAAEKPLQIVTTNFAGYDFARRITGDCADVRLLLSPGEEVHSYEPSAQDMITIQSCDLFVCVGGESEDWVDRVLDAAQPVKTLRMMDCVETVHTGEALESDHADHEDHADHAEHAHAEEYDEHVWTSAANAMTIVSDLCKAVCAADPENRTVYEAETAAYLQELSRLDAAFRETVAAAPHKLLVMADRFPFLYLTREYGLEYLAAFPGCSSGTEASAATVAALIDRVQSDGLDVVFYIEFSNQKLADTVCESTGAEKRLLHSCHNVTKDEFDGGATYLSLMEHNLAAIREALN